MSQYYPPEFDETHYHCPHCNVHAQLLVVYLTGVHDNDFSDVLRVTQCNHCRAYVIWFAPSGTLIYPEASTVPMPCDDMPEDVKADYNEARGIVSKSPKGAAALLRLAIQRLMPHLGEPGKNIDTDIASLIKKGLPPLVQQALDSVRVVGNECVHPGTMDIKDTPEVAIRLFDLVNFIVQDRITNPKQVEAIFQGLPAGKLQGIANRDKGAQRPKQSPPISPTAQRAQTSQPLPGAGPA